MIGQDEAAPRGRPHPDAVAVDIQGGAEPQLRIGQVLPAVGIHDRVLSGAEKGHEYGRRHHPDRALNRVGKRQNGDGRHQRQLRDQQPPPPAAEKRRREPVQDRGPQELPGIGALHQGDHAHPGEIDTLLGHPGLQNAQRQQQGQAAGEPHQQGNDHPAAEKCRHDRFLGLRQGLLATSSTETAEGGFL